MKIELATTTYEVVAPHVARIMMNRPEVRNAQDDRMTYDLNACFDRAAQDDEIKVVLLGGEGPHFSAGHDLRAAPTRDIPIVGTWAQPSDAGVYNRYSREREMYLGLCQRWRDMPKPTIALVQGKCIAGGLMLAWVCDIILAGEDATFIDPVVGLGVCGVEYFAHPYELGLRKAKELLFTADWWDAREAHRLGMVNHVVPNADLEAFALAMALKIAEKPAFALKTAKQALNNSRTNMGERPTMESAFALHQLCHAYLDERPELLAEHLKVKKIA
jgi:enoyl-CoA hydratase